MNNVGRRHYLIKDDIAKSAKLFSPVDIEDDPDVRMIEVKTGILQLLQRLSQCPIVNQQIISDPNSMTILQYQSHVCFARRIVASVLDDLQVVVFPFLSRKRCWPKEMRLIMLRFGSNISRLLGSLSMSKEGFILMRTEMKVIERPNRGHEDDDFATSCIGVMADFLEHSTLLLLSSEGYRPETEIIADTLECNTMRETIQSALSFFFSIHCQCQAGLSQGGKYQTSFYRILLDSERLQSVVSSLRIVQSVFGGDESKIIHEDSARCWAQIMIQSLLNQ